MDLVDGSIHRMEFGRQVLRQARPHAQGPTVDFPKDAPTHARVPTHRVHDGLRILAVRQIRSMQSNGPVVHTDRQVQGLRHMPLVQASTRDVLRSKHTRNHRLPHMPVGLDLEMHAVAGQAPASVRRPPQADERQDRRPACRIATEKEVLPVATGGAPSPSGPAVRRHPAALGRRRRQ